MTLRVETAGPVRAEVFDARGRRIYISAAEAGTLTVPTAGLAAGVYGVRVEAGGETGSRGFVVR